MRSLSQVKPVLCSLLLVCSQAFASPLAKSVVEASPLDDILAQYPAMMNEGFRQGLQQGGGMNPMVVTAITTVVSNSFSAAQMQSQLVTDLSSSLTEKQLKAVGEWYETPLASKISKAEINATSPSAWRKMEQGANEMQAKYRGSERAKLFTRFDKAARATESTVDATIAVQTGLMTAISAMQGPDGAEFEQIQKMMEAQRDQMRAMVAQQVYDSYLFTYENLTVDELKDYIGFLETDAGSAFTRVSIASIQKSITEPLDNIGRQFVRIMKGG